MTESRPRSSQIANCALARLLSLYPPTLAADDALACEIPARNAFFLIAGVSLVEIIMPAYGTARRRRATSLRKSPSETGYPALYVTLGAGLKRGTDIVCGPTLCMESRYCE